MSGSSTEINYAIRPCKSVERKMMCEMISKLNAFQRVDEYRYIGMGAKYFVDFILLHKEFGINKMYSLEISSDENSKMRFDFNKPYDCIQMKHGSAGDILSSAVFPWKDERNIIWLDYDGGITGKQISDVGTCFGKIESGSLVFVSFNIDFGDKFKKASPDGKLEIFSERIGNDDLVKRLKPVDVSGKNIENTIRRLFNMAIENKLLERNYIIKSENKKLIYEQIAFFKYADSKAQMLTIGWVVYSKEDKEKFEQCSFESLEFYRSGDEFYDISVPNLTYKEVSLLNRHMPNATYPLEGAEFFEKDEVEKYKKIYRYYPATFEVENIL